MGKSVAQKRRREAEACQVQAGRVDISAVTDTDERPRPLKKDNVQLAFKSTKPLLYTETVGRVSALPPNTTYDGQSIHAAVGERTIGITVDDASPAADAESPVSGADTLRAVIPAPTTSPEVLHLRLAPPA